MTSAVPRIDYWRDAQGGFRGSQLLAMGAGLLALGGLISLLDPWLARALAVRTAELGWLSYILGLGLVGLGFGWTCVPGILPRVGIATAVLHVGQAAYLLVLLYGRNAAPVAPVALTVGRLLSVLVLTIAAADMLGRRCALTLGLVAGASLAKALLRVLGPGLDGGAAIDALFLVLLAGGLWAAAHRLRAVEDDWARRHHPGNRTDFAEFNNPEHDWNKQGGQGRVEQARMPR